MLSLIKKENSYIDLLKSFLFEVYFPYVMVLYTGPKIDESLMVKLMLTLDFIQYEEFYDNFYIMADKRDTEFLKKYVKRIKPKSPSEEYKLILNPIKGGKYYIVKQILNDRALAKHRYSPGLE